MSCPHRTARHRIPRKSCPHRTARHPLRTEPQGILCGVQGILCKSVRYAYHAMIVEGSLFINIRSFSHVQTQLRPKCPAQRAAAFLCYPNSTRRPLTGEPTLEAPPTETPKEDASPHRFFAIRSTLTIKMSWHRLSTNPPPPPPPPAE